MAIDLCRDVAVKAVRQAANDLVRAGKAIPSVRHLWRPGGMAGHALGIVAHCAAQNLFLASALAGSPLPYRTKEEQDEAISACVSMKMSEEFLDRSLEACCEAILSLSDDRLSESMMMPWGERIPVALGLLAPALHMRNHEGQLNYIQLLLGDDEYH